VFFGKLVKQAMGLESTHARDGRLDLGWLADRAREAGAAGEHVAAIRGANTAREALDVVRTDPGFAHLLEGLSSAWFASARGFAGGGPALGLAVFDLEGRVLIERREEKGEPA
jgi:cobalt-precorrin-5B (C1)-methyltransferase